MELQKLLRGLDRDVRLNPVYVSKAGKAAGGGLSFGPGGGAGPLIGMLHDDEGVSVQGSQSFMPSSYGSLSDALSF